VIAWGDADGLTADEIDNLKKEAAAFREVRQKMSETDGAKRVFEKVRYGVKHRRQRKWS
jgi:hypothetical protein